MMNKKELIRWIDKEIRRSKETYKRLIKNRALIKKLKKGTAIYCPTFYKREDESRRGKLIVDCLMEKGISLIYPKTKEDFYVPWSHFVGYNWRAK